MRYVVLGAGAIGGTIAARLFLHDQSVTLIARGDHLASIQKNGLVFSEPSGTATLPIDAVASPQAADLQPDDVVILATKSQDTPAAIAAIAAAAPPEIAVVCAQNGVNNERVALRYFSHVGAAFVVVAADHLEPGVVHRFGAPFVGVLDVGGYPDGTSEWLEDVAADLEMAGFRSAVRPDVMRAKYRKLYFNLGNVVEALIGRTDIETIADLARAEADAVFTAAGISMVSREEDLRRRDGLQTVPAHAGSRSGGSTWQSLARGADSIETDYLNGEVVLLGRLHGIATPVNEVLCEEARTLVRAKAAPGSVPPEVLRSRIDERLAAGR